ncbi:hypothetical protein ACIG5E_19220 [Kitasatospora sp. NPDC053057]|uniref:hypothetical protein n=1 Tax=Kitasatospora sp. NPDC053057 TaxID=3364062 RepID=UPI0037CA1A41
MVDFHDLSTADLGVLDAAATAWTTVAQKLKSIDDDWMSTVTTKVDSVCWDGTAAGLARAGLKHTNDQLHDAATEANALASVFKEAAKDFKAARTKLDKAVADARAAQLTVSDSGVVSWPPADTATRHDPEMHLRYQQEWGAKADAASAAMSAAVAEATAADERMAAALTSDAGTGADHAFNGKAIGGPETDGARAAALMQKGGDISDTELTELNTLLALNSADPAFSTKFYQDLTPDGLIKSWYFMVGDRAHIMGTSDARWAAYKELQKNLGLSLATATRQDSQPHLSDDWAAQLRRAGAQPVWYGKGTPHGPEPVFLGYQVLAPILETGQYDAHFLDPIAEHITQMDAHQHNGHWPAPIPDGLRRGFNLLGDPKDGAGYQPTTAILTALGHSPEASTEFFTHPPTAYKLDDGTVLPGGQAKPADYLNYYVHDKEWSSDTLDKDAWGHPSKAGPAALGHALEAATSGHPFDQPGWRAADGTPLTHDAAQAGLMKRVVDTFGSTHGDGGVLDDLKGDGKLSSMRVSLGNMTADYIGDVQQTVAKAPGLPVKGTAAGLDGGHTVRLLDALGRDPDSYAVVANANQAYTTALIQGHVAGGGVADWQLSDDVKHAAHSGGAVTGVISEARIDQVHNQHAASDKAYNDAVDRNGGLIKDVVNGTLHLVPESVPLADKLPGVADAITDSVIKANKIDTTEVGRDEASAYQDQTVSKATSGARQAVADAGRAAGLSPDKVQTLGNTAADGASDGYTFGLSRELSVLAKGSDQ